VGNLWLHIKNGLFDLRSFRFKNKSFWFHKLPPWCPSWVWRQETRMIDFVSCYCHATATMSKHTCSHCIFCLEEDRRCSAFGKGNVSIAKERSSESKQGWWIRLLLPMTDCPRSSSSCILVNLCHKWARRKVSLEEQVHRVLVLYVVMKWIGTVLSAGIAWCCGLPINRFPALDGSKYFRDLNTYHARKGTKCNIIGKFTCLMSFHPHFRCPDSDTSWNTQCFGDDCDVICLWEPFCSYDGTEK
jgi:hypothetical protein